MWHEDAQCLHAKCFSHANFSTSFSGINKEKVKGYNKIDIAKQDQDHL